MRTRKFPANIFSKRKKQQISGQDQNTASSDGQQKLSPKSNLILWVTGGILGILLISVIILFIVNSSLESEYSGKIEPGVSVSGVYLGKMTRDEAKATLQKQLDGYTQKPVVLSFQDQNWKPTLEQLGVSINLDGSLDQALKYDHPNSFLDGSRIFKLLNPQSTNIPLEIQLDETQLKNYLDGISNTIRKDAVEPNLELKDGQAVVTAGSDGYQIDYENTFQSVKNSLVTLIPSSQNLLQVTTIKPVNNEADLNTTRDKINAIAGKPLTIQYNDKNWTLDQKTLAGMISLQHTSNPGQPTTYSFTIKNDYVKTFVSDLAKGINQEPINGVLGWNGHLVAKVQSKPGLQLSVDKSVDAIMQRINDPESRTAQLVVEVRKPDVDTSNLDAFGIKEVIGEGVSHYGGSDSARGHNIETGADYLTGTFIKPHSTFSFLDTIGEISEKRGYWKGYAIVADQTVPDVGGGICQVSTTTFRAAFFAGLPIAERHEHAYRVHWYEEMDEPVGFDAAVYQPGSDFKFENPYDTWLYLQASVGGGYLHVRLYGTKVQGQTVELKASGPKNLVPAKADRIEVDPSLPTGVKKQVDFAQQGLDADITRIIKVNGQVVKTSVFPSHFQAWGNIFKVGPPPAPKPTAQPTPVSTTTSAPQQNQSTPAPTTTKVPVTTTPNPTSTPKS